MMNRKAPISVDESYERAEEMARRRLPHLYRVARLFPDRDRYLAFCATYASMRWVDDRVDEGQSALPELKAWQNDIRSNIAGRPGSAVYGPALTDVFAKFEFSPEPWDRLLEAMRYDLEADGFPDYSTFLSYAEGATVAPASVFASLLLMRPEGDRWRSALPYATIRDAVRDSAISCYEVHILRDAKEDLEAGRNYFPQDELKSYHLDPTAGLSSEWRPYLRAYGMRTRGEWACAIGEMKAIEGPMTERERLMLHLLTEFYGRSLRKISRLNYDVWSDRHWPDASEISELLEDLADRFEPGVDLSELAVQVTEDV